MLLYEALYGRMVLSMCHMRGEVCFRRLSFRLSILALLLLGLH